MNQTLTRRLAVAQTTVQLLDSLSSVLSDLGDLQAHRAFRARVMEFIAAKHAEGECPADPLSACRPVVERAAAALDAARAQAEAWAAIDLPEGDRWALRIGRVELDDVLLRAREALRSLGDTAARLAAGFDAREWAGGDLDGELLRLAGILYPPDHLLSAASTDDRRGLFALATQASGVRENVVGHLRRVEAEALQLIAAHDAESSALSDAVAAAEAGNHLTARRIAGGLRGNFTDLDCGQVENVCRALFAGAEEIERRWQEARDARVKLPVGADGASIREIQGRLDAILKLAAGPSARGGAQVDSEAAREIDARVRGVMEEARALRDSLDRALGRPAAWFRVWVVFLLAGGGLFLLIMKWAPLGPDVAFAAAIGGSMLLLVFALIVVMSWGFRLKLPPDLFQPRVYLDGVPAGLNWNRFIRALPGEHRVEVDALGRDTSRPAEVRVSIFGQPNLIVGDLPMRRGYRCNTLGMIFVWVPMTGVWWSVWQTRVSDYWAFKLATGGSWKTRVCGDWAVTPNQEKWSVAREGSFEQGTDHPAVHISYQDAKEFCEWLTQRERLGGSIGPADEYRLPTNHEWQSAAGKGKYPWGDWWPPPRGAGNYGPKLHVDHYRYTSPVGSFDPNNIGLFDMGGNVWEWCAEVVARGGAWDQGCGFESDEGILKTSFQLSTHDDGGADNVGFRCVLVASGS